MCAIYIRLRELRVALGLSQAELATRAGVRRATVSRIENAHVSGINFNVLEKVADVLGVEPGMLISRVPPGVGPDGRQRSPGRGRRAVTPTTSGTAAPSKRERRRGRT